MVFLSACNVWAMRCTALLCRAILSPLRNGCSHVDSRWGHVSRSFLWHSVQLGFGCVIGQNMFFLWLPIYWAYLNLSVWVIWVSGIFSSCQKWLESFWFIWVLDSHLSTYGNLCLARFASFVSCSLVMNVRKLRMAPSCVDVGQPASQYGVEWAVCIRGVVSGFSLVVPSFARSSAISFPVMPV